MWEVSPQEALGCYGLWLAVPKFKASSVTAVQTYLYTKIAQNTGSSEGVDREIRGVKIKHDGGKDCLIKPHKC